MEKPEIGEGIRLQPWWGGSFHETNFSMFMLMKLEGMFPRLASIVCSLIGAWRQSDKAFIRDI